MDPLRSRKVKKEVVALSTKVPPVKNPLDRETLRDIIDLCLWTGQLLLQHGAEAERVEETVHRLGTAFGCDWLDILVSPNVLAITVNSGEEFRSKIRRIVRFGVDLNRVTAINSLSRRVEKGEINRSQYRAFLERIDKGALHHNRWVVVGMVGLACAAFCGLSGGDSVAVGITFVAASIAMMVRQELQRRYFNPLLVVVATAFVASLISSSGAVFNWTTTPEAALVASVLLLVPGVPLINAAEDIIKGHLLMGLARGVNGILVSLAIALGMLIAFWLTGVRFP